VGPLSVSATTAEDVEWVRIEDLTAAGGARRAATRLAEQLAFPPARAAELGLAVTEIATNLARHARAGSVLLRALRGVGTAVEVVAVDAGPGMDVDRSRRDGHSSAGTLGIGLGAIDRLADDTDITSAPGVGTILVARFDADRRAPVPADPTAAALTRPITGETVCGDACWIRHDRDRTLLLLCDGLGHGPQAAAASQRATATARAARADRTGPDELVAAVHAALSGTRGGAVAVAELDPVAGVVRFCGVGNVAGAVVTDGRKRGMTSAPGVAGMRARTVRRFEYPLEPTSVVVMHSDGLSGRWTLDPEVLARSPVVVAAALLREAGVRHDDAGVIVARPRRVDEGP
jgi:anti-sigma regulatory factor (Ser/Thr protein kinase)